MANGFQLEQCSAIITGASSGLGAEFARQLAPKATTLLLAARSEERLLAFKAELAVNHPKLTINVCPCDLTTEEGRGSLLDAAKQGEPQPNLLINNAGVGDYGDLASADPAKINSLMNLNVSTPVLLAQALMPVLRASANTPAAILNVSSLASTVPMPGLAVYAASKAFVTSFSEALRVEVADRHIIVSAVCPGPTPTNFSKNARRADGKDTDRSGQAFLQVPPAEVVQRGLQALRQNQACVFPGLGVKLAATIFRYVPRTILRWMMRQRYLNSRP